VLSRVEGENEGALRTGMAWGETLEKNVNSFHLQVKKKLNKIKKEENGWSFRKSMNTRPIRMRNVSVT